MALMARLAPAFLVPALAAGCSQSLFDASPGGGGGGGGGDGGPGRDGSIAPGRPDARPSVGPDARPAGPDGGGIVDECPVPNCLGHAVAQFATDQNGPWRYVEVRAGLLGFLPMFYASTRVPPAWLSQGEAPHAAITNCTPYAGLPQCMGLDQRLLLEPNPRLDARPPGLVWIAPTTGSYRLTMDWRLASTQLTSAPATVLLARNSEHDQIRAHSFTASTEVDTFPDGSSVDLDVVAGDAVALALLDGAEPTDVPLGVRVFASDLGTNIHCQMAFKFQGAGSFQNACGSGAFVETGTATMELEQGQGIPGSARLFLPGSLLAYQGGEINDYRGDWTLQFWARLQGDGTLLTDLSCRSDGAGIASGGIAARFDGDTLYIIAAEETRGADYCSGLPPQSVTLSRGSQFADPGDWHFYRIVRRTAENRVEVCLDGQPEGVLDIPAAATMATDRLMVLGADDFGGQIADLRLHDRALPCSAF